uniref:WRKY domain-containing protein n=3 Tax=Aegilops tauschii subsp. strangulata TaxID=200361 RepID=A0A453FTU4_AEGTS
MALATPTAVVLELMTMGQQSAAHLRDLLRAASPPVQAEHQALAAEILRCCDRVIAAVSAGAADKKRKAADPGATSCHPPMAAMPSKRRVRGAEAHREVHADTTADGFVWRKYGQKDINGSNHPRYGQEMPLMVRTNGKPVDQTEQSLTLFCCMQALLPLRAQRRGLPRDPAGAAVAGGARGVRDRLLRRAHLRSRLVSAKGGATASYCRRLRLKRLGSLRCRRPEQGLASAAVARSRARRRAPSRRGAR